jgi:hypothetical protein
VLLMVVQSTLPKCQLLPNRSSYSHLFHISPHFKPVHWDRSWHWLPAPPSSLYNQGFSPRIWCFWLGVLPLDIWSLCLDGMHCFSRYWPLPISALVVLELHPIAGRLLFPLDLPCYLTDPLHLRKADTNAPYLPFELTLFTKGTLWRQTCSCVGNRKRLQCFPNLWDRICFKRTLGWVRLGVLGYLNLPVPLL